MSLGPTDVMLNNVRLSFPDLFQKVASVDGGKEKYRANFLIDPSTREGKKAIKALEAAKAYAEEATFKKTGISYKEGRCALVEGEECTNQTTGEPYDGYAGMMAFKASTEKRPRVMAKDKSIVMEGDDECPYAGCYVNALVSVYCVKGKDKGGNGFFAEFRGVQFLKDGESFGGGMTNQQVDDAFEAFEDDDDDDVLDDDDDV